jgi:uncharacterized protein (TIGR02246 family)
MRADAQTEAALLEILERFCSGFAGQDADGVMQLFAPEADIVMVTSEESLLRGPDEVKTFLHRYAQGTTRYSWAWDRFDVAAAGAVGWVLAEGTETAAAEKREEKHPYRMSMVCVKRDGRWLLVQVHGSSPHHG